MDPVGETTPLLVAGVVLREEAAAFPTSPIHKRSFSKAHQVATLMLVTTVWSFSFEIIYPFINQFILEIGVTDNPEDVGFYSGWVESTFAFVQLLTVMPASAISDRCGRKVVLLFGMTGVAVGMPLFGISTKYWMMLATRCISGGIGGAKTAVRVMAGEISDKDSQSSTYTLIAITYRMGQIVGQPIGGLLAHPERRWSGLFAGWFWTKYPFALPCFVGAGWTLCTAAYATVVLKETLTTKSPRHPPAGTPVIMASERGRIRSSLKTLDSTLRSVLTWPLLSMLFNHSVMVLMSGMLFAIYPLFAFMPVEKGGLGLSEAQIGLHMSFRAVISVLTMIPYPYLERRFGLMRTYRFSMSLWPVTIALFPLLNLIARMNGEDRWVWYGTLFVFFIVWAFTGWAWTAMYIMVTRASPNTEALSLINSLSSIFIVIPSSISPAIATSSFSLSIQSEILGGNLIWAVMGAVGAAGFVHSMTLSTMDDG